MEVSYSGVSKSHRDLTHLWIKPVRYYDEAFKFHQTWHIYQYSRYVIILVFSSFIQSWHIMNTASTLLFWRFQVSFWHIYAYRELVIIPLSSRPDIFMNTGSMLSLWHLQILPRPNIFMNTVSRLVWRFQVLSKPDKLMNTVCTLPLWHFEVFSKPDKFMNTVCKLLLWRFQVSFRLDTFMHAVSTLSLWRFQVSSRSDTINKANMNWKPATLHILCYGFNSIISFFPDCLLCIIPFFLTLWVTSTTTIENLPDKNLSDEVWKYPN